MFIVKVIEKSTGIVEKVIGCKSEKEADRVEAGLLYNLNHAEYRTEIEESKNA